MTCLHPLSCNSLRLLWVVPQVNETVVRLKCDRATKTGDNGVKPLGKRSERALCQNGTFGLAAGGSSNAAKPAPVTSSHVMLRCKLLFAGSTPASKKIGL